MLKDTLNSNATATQILSTSKIIFNADIDIDIVTAANVADSDATPDSILADTRVVFTSAQAVVT